MLVSFNQRGASIELIQSEWHDPLKIHETQIFTIVVLLNVCIYDMTHIYVSNIYVPEVALRSCECTRKLHEDAFIRKATWNGWYINFNSYHIQQCVISVTSVCIPRRSDMQPCSLPWWCCGSFWPCSLPYSRSLSTPLESVYQHACNPCCRNKKENNKLQRFSMSSQWSLTPKSKRVRL